MQRRTIDLAAHLDRHHAALCAALSAVPLSLREQRPAPDRWSAANVVDHVAVVESRIGQALGRRFEQARRAGLPAAPDTPVVAAGDGDRYLDRTQRLESTAAAGPHADLEAPAALAHLEAVRADTHRLLRETDGLDVSSVTLPHPIFGLLTFYEWVVFLGGHEGRHARQIDEVGRALSGQA